jgi:hypothetical protein
LGSLSDGLVRGWRRVFPTVCFRRSSWRSRPQRVFPTLRFRKSSRFCCFLLFWRSLLCGAWIGPISIFSFKISRCRTLLLVSLALLGPCKVALGYSETLLRLRSLVFELT